MNYTTVEALATDLGQTRDCLHKRLKKLGWGSADLKDPVKFEAFIALKESPHKAINSLVNSIAEFNLRLDASEKEIDNLHTKFSAIEILLRS